jgi:hypothetical protein
MTAPVKHQASAYEEAAFSMKPTESLWSYEHGRKLARSRGEFKNISKDSLKRTRGRGSSAPQRVHSSDTLLMDYQTAQGHYAPAERDNTTPYSGS